MSEPSQWPVRENVRVKPRAKRGKLLVQREANRGERQVKIKPSPELIEFYGFLKAVNSFGINLKKIQICLQISEN